MEITEDRPGMAWIEAGKLSVSNPLNSDTYAAIAPGKHVRLTVNGRPVEERALVREDDDIQIEIIHDESNSSLELNLSPDKAVTNSFPLTQVI